MTKPGSITQVKIRRALKVARKEGLRLVIHADGSMTYVPAEFTYPHQSTEGKVEPEREIVL